MNDGRTEPEREALPLEDVGRLVELLAESGIGEIRVRQGELEITVKARSEAAAGTPSAPQTEPQATPRIEITPVPEAEPSVEYPAERNGGLHVVRSPVVGTFYRAPTPGGEPYAEVGDHVGAGQPLCIVEAMKLMNEIAAGDAGKVVEIVVEDGEAVEFEQILMYLEPASE
jgi:acetyl-CoA carboxylase biotin carboxyl carrier protein